MKVSYLSSFRLQQMAGLWLVRLVSLNLQSANRSNLKMRLVFGSGARLLELRRLKQAPSTVHATCDGMCYVGHYFGNYLRHFKIEIYEDKFLNVKHYLPYYKE